MTSEDQKRFESQWPAVAARLDSMLARRGVPPDRREDIVQETGLKLLKTWERVDASKPLWPLTVTIALNLMRDQARKGLFTEVPTEIPDRSASDNVEELNLARLELKRAGLALAQLNPGQREVLLAEVDPASYRSTSSPAATKMLRMRARRKLSVLMQQVSALALAPVAAIKRVGRLGHLFPFSRASEGVVTSALCGVLCVVALGGSAGLAPFSALPEDLQRDSSRPERSRDEAAAPAALGYIMVSGSIGGSIHTSVRAEIQEVKDRLTDPETGTSPKGSVSSPEESAGIRHESNYEVPVAGKTIAQGTVGVEVFNGGHGPGAPGNIDCHERMISPDEINATCWDQSDPNRRYGARIRHEGKTTVDHLVLPH